MRSRGKDEKEGGRRMTMMKDKEDLREGRAGRWEEDDNVEKMRRSRIKDEEEDKIRRITTVKR